MSLQAHIHTWRSAWSSLGFNLSVLSEGPTPQGSGIELPVLLGLFMEYKEPNIDNIIRHNTIDWDLIILIYPSLDFISNIYG